MLVGLVSKMCFIVILWHSLSIKIIDDFLQLCHLMVTTASDLHPTWVWE